MKAVQMLAMGKKELPFKMEVLVTDSESFTLPLITGYNYNFVVTWGDGNSGTITSFDDADATHVYTTGATYTIEILGTCENIYFNNGGNKLNVKKITQWGTTGFKTVNFFNCSNLTSIIAPTNSKELKYITSFENSFASCSGLTSIPTSLFANSISNLTFKTTFNFCTGLTSIPTGLFDKNTLVTTFESVFNSCSNITSMPSGLFDKNTLVTNFRYAFNDCEDLIAIQSGLFDNNSLITTFASTFQGCTSLTAIPSGLITSVLHSSLTIVLNCFYDCTGINTTVYEIWNDAGFSGITTGFCFYNDVSITNYADIPNAWGGA